MNTTHFGDTLRDLLRRQPFQPFEVELAHGEHFTVDRADAVALNGDSAGFIAEDGSIHFFTSENTARFVSAVNGSAS
jgi:hypothetical protein